MNFIAKVPFRPKENNKKKYVFKIVKIISRIVSKFFDCKLRYCPQQKYSTLRQPLQKFNSVLKAEPVYEGRLKVILLLQAKIQQTKIAVTKI